MIRNKGYIVEDLLKDLIIHFRNLSVIKFKNGLKLIGLEPELAKKYSESNYSWSDKDIIRLSNNLSSLYASIKQYSDQYLLFEMQLIKLLQFDSSIDIEKFLKEDNKNTQQTKTVETAKKPLKKTEKIIPELKKTENIQSEDLKSNWETILQTISKQRGSIGAQLSGCILGEIENNKIELISYDNSEFNQKLLNDSLPLLKSVIDEKFNSSVEIKLIIDTKVEKIENDEENQVNENDIVNLFEGKDML
jgi:DNA polymerase-3 subunit gamma/tau